MKGLPSGAVTVEDGLAAGPGAPLADTHMLEGFDALVCLVPEARVSPPPGAEEIVLPVNTRGLAGLVQSLARAGLAIRALRASGRRVYVYCSRGCMALLAAAASLVLRGRASPVEALELIRSLRPDCAYGLTAEVVLEAVGEIARRRGR